MRKYFKISCRILIVILLLAVALYFIPWRTSIGIYMYGAVVTADGQILYKKDVYVSGHISEYLFQKDHLDLAFYLDEPYWNDIKVDHSFSNDGRWPYILANWDGYNRQLNRYDGGPLGLTFEKDMMILSRFGEDDHYLVASVNPDFEPQEILQKFSDLLD